MKKISVLIMAMIALSLIAGFVFAAPPPPINCKVTMKGIISGHENVKPDIFVAISKIDLYSGKVKPIKQDILLPNQISLLSGYYVFFATALVSGQGGHIEVVSDTKRLFISKDTNIDFVLTYLVNPDIEIYGVSTDITSTKTRASEKEKGAKKEASPGMH